MRVTGRIIAPIPARTALIRSETVTLEGLACFGIQEHLLSPLPGKPSVDQKRSEKVGGRLETNLFEKTCYFLWLE
jgi:hypothetical protein